MTIFIDQIVNGVTLGAVYALIAIGYTMVYGIIGMINFAHGEIYMIGAYCGVITLSVLGMMAGVPLPIVIIGALLFAVPITALFGWTVERLAYRPLRSSPRLVPLISAIGMSIFLMNLVQLGQSSKDIPIPSLIPGRIEFTVADRLTVVIPYINLLVIGVTIALMVALTLFISRSRIGRACRAAASDMQMAGLLGIDTNRVISFIFVLGAALAAVAGVLVALVFPKINPYIGFAAGLKAFTAAVVGGIGSIPGAMLGGLLLGIVETFTAGYLQSDYKDIAAFGLLILVLLVRPTGLLGKPDIEKV